MSYAAAIPVYQGGSTLASVVRSLQAQTCAPEEIVLMDDGSTDGAVDRVASAAIRIVRHEINKGRGAARASAMRATTGPLVMMCDAGLQPAVNFAEQALKRLDDPQVAAVFGRIAQSECDSVADRWCDRHLFRFGGGERAVNEAAALATGACLLRRSAVEQVGGFDETLRSAEDADLGRRLLASGWKVVFDPTLSAVNLSRQTIGHVLARYARWNSPNGLGAREWYRQMAYAVKVMAVEDLRAGDLPSVGISLLTPFFQMSRR